MALNNGTQAMWPPMSDVLKAIQRETGKLNDQKSQNDLLRGLLMPAYTNGLNDDEIHDKINKLRKKLTGIICSNGRRQDKGKWVWQSKWIGPGLKDLFEEGPRFALKDDFLLKMGLELEDADDGDDTDHSSDEGGEEEEDDVGPPPAKQPERRDPESDDEYEPPAMSSNKNPLKRPAIAASANTDVDLAMRPDKKKPKTAADGDSARAEREMWATEAGQNAMPAILPTKAPKSPTEMIVAGDKVWLNRHLEKLEKALWDTTMAYFHQHGIDAAAPSNFVLKPSDELFQLYKTLCGDDQVQEWVQIQQSRTGVAALRQDYTIMGLLGASVYWEIFEKAPKWDVRRDIQQCLGINVKYLRQAIDDVGHDLDTILRNVVGKQVSDKEFLDQEVAGHASAQTKSIASNLQAHLQALRTTTNVPAAMQYRPWLDTLEQAVGEAVKIKQTLLASPQGPFMVYWPVSGLTLDGAEHRAYFDSERPDHVLHGILPGFKRKVNSEASVFCRALVIPTSSSEVMQP